MAGNNNILIICRDLKSIRRLSRFSPQPQNSYILASDDPRVHIAAKKYPWIGKISWIEQMESFYNVANDVIRFLNIINNWLKSFGDEQYGIPKELLYWVQHCEGGMTTQRIQDLLLLIRSYLHLFETFNISSLKILCCPGMHWEDNVLAETARSRGINVHIIGRFQISVLKKKVIGTLKMIAREPYYIFNIFWVKWHSKYSYMRIDKYKKQILIQPCGSEPKHLQYVIPLMKSINEKGYTSVALCWEMANGAACLRSKGFRAEELENWLPISAIWKVAFRALITCSKAVIRRKELMLNSSLQYNSVSITKLLSPSFQFFFIGELPQRYRLMIAAKKCFEVHSPLAIRFCTTILPQSVIPFRCLKKNKRTIIFHQPGKSFITESPYHHHKIPVDLVFALDVEHKKKLEKEGFPSNNVIIIGNLNKNELSDFKNKYSRKRSLLYLKIPSTYSLYIFYDPGHILKGYKAASEEACTTEFLLDFVKTNSSIALIIKPHPRHHPGILESQIGSYALQNVFLINNKMLPHHCLNAADLIITKYSTVGIEAMYIDRPVISVILDGETNFKFYANAAKYIYSIQELGKLLNSLINDENYRSHWALKLKEQSIKFLDLSNYKVSKSPSELTADAVDALIKAKGV